ncbi:MAG: hypothetical protein HDT35_01840 [Clostridiales bacterium]|nr:hypothetical protein [Clostridiales bacterium]
MIKSSDTYQEAIVADGRRMHVKAVVDIEDPDMVQGEVTSVEQEPGISRPEQVWDKNFALNAHYASMEPNRWILDGSYILRPEDAATRDWEAGLVGAVLSGEDGVFPVPQWAQIDFQNVGVLQACAVAFSDRLEDGVAVDFTVEVISEGVAYHTTTVTGNTKSHVSIIGFRVNRPDTIRVTVTRWSLPGRRMRVVEIVPGVYEIWTGREIEKSGLTVKMQGDPSCVTLPYGTASITMDNESRRFDPRTKDGIFLMLEDRQGIELYMGPELPDGTVEYKKLGVFYQANGGWMTGNNAITMRWDLVDIIGLLVNRTYMPKGDPPTTLKGWLEALAGQLGESFVHRVRVDPDYADLPVAIPDKEAEKMTCGEILRHVCMATGTWPRADQTTGYLAAEPTWNEGNKLTLRNLNKYPTMSANGDVAAVTVNGYTIDGTAPACGNTLEIENPCIPSAQRLERARALLAFYGGNRLETVGRGDPSSEIGDVDTIWLAEGNATAARRIKQEFSISGGVLKNCSSTFVRGDGLFLFQERVQILESGEFVVPEGVWRLRVILVGHGWSGRPGTDGTWNNHRNQFMGEHIFTQAPNGGYGVDGSPGAGGMVWEGIIDVNPGQVFQVSVPPDGGHTVFGKYSSGDGKQYPNGFTDIATGDVYGRTGVRNPAPGSGDGGEGGAGGQAGSWYVVGHWYYDDGYVYPGTSEGGWGVDPGHDTPGHWERESFVERHPTDGKPGAAGATGCVIIYWDPPEVIDNDDT